MSSKGRTALFVVILLGAIGLVLALTLGKRSTSGPAVRMGAVLFLTGDAKSYGEQFRDGAQLAVNEINGSPDGPVEVIYYDSEGNKDLGLEKLKTLKERDKVRFVAEIMGSGVGLNAIPYITENRMLTLSGVNTSPDFSAHTSPYFFRIIPSDGVAAEQLARWALESGYKKGAMVYATDTWGTGLKGVLEQAYTRAGGQLVALKDSEQKQTVFQPIVSELKAAAPDVVFLVMYPREAGLLLKEAKKQGFKSRFMGTDNFTGSELAQVGGDAVDGVMFVLPSANTGGSEPSRRFQQLYKTAYGTAKEPPLFSVMGYDCVRLMAKVIKESGGDVEKAKQLLAATRYEGASGPIAFNEWHDVVIKDYARKVYAYDVAAKSARATDFVR
jgi:branched-chain amino acid transport system substrate-binding protein